MTAQLRVAQARGSKGLIGETPNSNCQDQFVGWATAKRLPTRSLVGEIYHVGTAQPTYGDCELGSPRVPLSAVIDAPLPTLR
jgi:hypothetical protein